MGVWRGENSGVVTTIGVAVAVAILGPDWRSAETGRDGGDLDLGSDKGLERSPPNFLPISTRDGEEWLWGSKAFLLHSFDFT